MSLILDALKRSRSEESSVPGVDTYHAPLDPEPAWRAYLPWIGLALALAVVAWLLLDRFGMLPGAPDESGGVRPSQQAPAVPAQRLAGGTNSPVARTAPATRPAPAPRPAAAPRNAPAQVAASAPRPAATRMPAAPAATVVEGEQADAAVADLYRERDRQLQAGAPPQEAAPATGRQAATQPQPEAAPATAVEEQPVDFEQLLEKARAELDAGEFVDHSAPFITDLSQQVRNPIPTILYQRHDYSGQVSRASVVMNGKTLRQGGSPAAGVKLEEILPNSAVLNYRGTQFRLRALNSWVNL